MYVVNQNIQAKYICISSTEKQWTKLSRRVQYDYSRSRVTVDLTVDAPREQQQLGHSVKCLSPRYLELTDSPGTRLFVSHDTWSWLTLPGRGSSRATILGVDWLYRITTETRLFQSHDTWTWLTLQGRGWSRPRYLELTDSSPGTRLFMSHDTWSWLTLQGRGLSRASILRVDWLYLGSPGTRLFKSHDTWRKLTTVSLLGRDKTRRNQQLIARQNTELFDFRK